MGWTFSRNYVFAQDGREFGRPGHSGDLYVEDDSRFRLHNMLPAVEDAMSYRHYRGCLWMHTIQLEEIVHRLKPTETAAATLH